MEQFHTSALALQKHLATLRRELAALDVQADLEKAEHLAALIAHIERALASLSVPLTPPTLQ